MRVKVNLKMLLELLLHPPSPLFYFFKKHQVCEMSPGRDNRLGTGRLWRVKGVKCFFLFWSSLVTGLLVLRLVTEVFY